MVNRMHSRCRWTHPHVDALLLASMIAGLSMAPALAFAQAIPQPAGMARDGDGELYLEVTLNQSRRPQLFRFVQRGERLFASSDTLRGIGFAIPGNTVTDMQALDTLPGVTWRYDAGQQRIAIDAPLPLLSLSTTRIDAPEIAPVAASASPGALLNYDLYGSRQQGATNLTATTEIRVFGIGDGILSNTAVTRGYRIPGDGWHGDTVRLDSNWEFSFPDSAVTVTIGDSFSGFLDWTRPVRLGGIQIGRNFGLQPYRVTTPLPAFLGEVAVPSAVDLYVNGIRQYSGELPTGPFQLSTVPGVSGIGNAQVVVTDAFGRTRTLDFPFYATQQLLAKGLSDWSVSAGVVREDYGLRSFSYASDPVASGNLRYGVSDRFTTEAHAEGGAGLVNAGAGGLWLLGRGGVANVSFARSTRDGADGWQSAIGYNWNNGRFNVAADSQRTHGDYRDLASLYGAPPPGISERALAGITAPQAGNFSVSYVRLQYPHGDASRYAGMFWSQTFRRGWSANFSLNQNLDDHDDRSAFLGFSFSFERDLQASVSLQRAGERDDAVLDVSRPLPGDGGYGWRLQARTGDGGDGGLAEAGWIDDHGRYGAGIASYAGDSYGYANASGSLVLMGGRAFVARDIFDGFALVSTDGIGGVPVKLENRVVGRTDDEGMLLVTRLNAWQRNKLSIDPMDLPANMRIDAVDHIVAPRDRSGTRVRFGITPVHAALLVLHDGDGDGKPLPLGSMAAIAGHAGGDAMVGYDGEVYVDDLDLDSNNRIRVTRPDGGACSVDVRAPGAGNTVPRIGPLACITERAP
jgi:outer membrane usher protein